MAAKKRHKDKSAMQAYSQFIAQAIAKEAVLLALNSLPYYDPCYCYGQSHHIYPKCLTKEDTGGAVTRGDNRAANLVFMTFADHVRAHVLLAAVYSEHHYLQNTPKFMLNVSGVQVSVLLAEQAELLRISVMAELTSKGEFVLQQPSTRKANAKVTSALQKQLVSEGKCNIVSDSASEASRQRAYDSIARGEFQLHTPEVKAKAKAASKAAIDKQLADGEHSSQIAYKCPHCCSSGHGTSAYAWHFDKCKLLTQAGACCDLSDRPARYKYCDQCNWSGCGGGNLAKHVKLKHEGLKLSDVGSFCDTVLDRPARSLFCDVPGCSFGAVRKATAKGLAKHMRLAHN